MVQQMPVDGTYVYKPASTMLGDLNSYKSFPLPPNSNDGNINTKSRFFGVLFNKYQDSKHPYIISPIFYSA